MRSLSSLVWFLLLSFILQVNPLTIQLDVNSNFHNLARFPAKFIELPQGVYQIDLETTFNYALGYDFAYNHKVVLFAVTNGEPNGHVWVVEKGNPITIRLFDHYNNRSNVKLWAFLPEGGDAKDNRGYAKVIVKNVGNRASYSLDLDVNANFLNLARFPAKFIELPQGVYQIDLETTFNYALGYDFAYNHKVMLFAVTNGEPNGHVWVVEKGNPITIRLFDHYNNRSNVKLWAFLPEGGDAKDNKGYVKISVRKIQ